MAKNAHDWKPIGGFTSECRRCRDTMYNAGFDSECPVDPRDQRITELEDALREALGFMPEIAAKDRLSGVLYRAHGENL